MDEVFERFVQQSPFSVMTRATLEHLFHDSFLDRVFAENARVQYQKELPFATVTTPGIDVLIGQDVLSQVVLSLDGPRRRLLLMY